MGLNITAQLVEMMDGQISVESEYEKGSVFTATVIQKVADDTPIGDFATNLTQMQEERERLRKAKKKLNDNFKSIYVRDCASAAKYLEKHE